MMTRDEKIAEARRLRDEGFTWAAAGRQLGVAGPTVWKWLHPERTREWNARDNANPDRVAEKARWWREYTDDPENRKRCPACGGPTHLYVVQSENPGICRSCVVARKERRRAGIVEGWGEGLTLRAIAARLGSTPESVGVEMVRMRAEGYDLPRRRRAKAM
jgi:DNA-directed RNA polymerase specialized sigma24 family protein